MISLLTKKPTIATLSEHSRLTAPRLEGAEIFAPEELSTSLVQAQLEKQQFIFLQTPTIIQDAITQAYAHLRKHAPKMGHLKKLKANTVLEFNKYDSFSPMGIAKNLPKLFPREQIGTANRELIDLLTQTRPTGLTNEQLNYYYVTPKPLIQFIRVNKPTEEIKITKEHLDPWRLTSLFDGYIMNLRNRKFVFCSPLLIRPNHQEAFYPYPMNNSLSTHFLLLGAEEQGTSRDDILPRKDKGLYRDHAMQHSVFLSPEHLGQLETRPNDIIMRATHLMALNSITSKY